MARSGGNIRTGDFSDKHVSIMEQMHEKESQVRGLDEQPGLTTAFFLGSMYDAPELISQLLSYGLVYNHMNADNEPLNRYSLTELGERRLDHARKAIGSRKAAPAVTPAPHEGDDDDEDGDGEKEVVAPKPSTRSSGGGARHSKKKKKVAKRAKVTIPHAPQKPKGPISKAAQAQGSRRPASKSNRHPDDKG